MDKMNEILQKISTYPQVDAIAIGGSRATNRYDASSDYDVYIYLNDTLPKEVREAILRPECKRLEIANHYWEQEDNGTMLNGVDFDLVYRDLAWLDNEVKDVVIDCHPHNSYTTCFWHNLLTCKIVYEKDSLLTELKEKYSVPYPDELKRAIITNNLNLLHGCIPSFDAQIKKAAKRGDLISVNHRMAEFLAAYFDLIFALNKVMHPGEKRMLQIAKDTCTLLPKQFEENIKRLLQTMYTHKVDEVLDEIINELVLLCEKENLSI